VKAIVYDNFGKADVLRLDEVPKPEPRPGDLLVEVKALGVNRADLLQRQGYYGTQTYGESALLGLELSGSVVAVGSDVTDVEPGDHVMAIVGGGAYAEYARVDRGMAVAIPEGFGFVEAAAIMESFVTAWEALVHLGEIAPGSSSSFMRQLVVSARRQSRSAVLWEHASSRPRLRRDGRKSRHSVRSVSSTTTPRTSSSASVMPLMARASM